VVDDNPDNRDMLSRRLKRRGFEIREAENGQQALECIAAEAFDLVILDVMMPVMDGLEALHRIREQHSVADLGVLMATAKDQPEDLAEALKLGANDYVTKPIDFKVALARIETQMELRRSVDRIRELESNLADRNRELEEANQSLTETNERMRRDLEAAARIQQAFLPGENPRVQTASFAWRYEPCDELAGDTLNIIPLDEEHAAMYVVDVSGHGVPAALLSVAISRLLSKTSGLDCVLRCPSELASDEPGSKEPRSLRISAPSEVAMELARRFPPNPDTHQYFTLIYGILHVPTRTFTFTCAGHPGPVLVRGKGEPEILKHPGFPIGIMPVEMMGDGFEDRVVKLDEGDRLYLYTDGIPEAENASEEDFGDVRFLRVLEEAKEEPLADSLLTLLGSVREFLAGSPVGDDVSLLAVEIES